MMPQNIASTFVASWIYVKPIAISSFDTMQHMIIFKLISEIVWKFVVHKFNPKFQTLDNKYIIYL